MLALRRGVVVEAGAAEGFQQLEVDVGGERRPAVVDVGLLGLCEPGDEVVVNVAARDLGLGSGGKDIVHVNLTRGLAGSGPEGAHVMKLNYTSLQHAILPVGEGDKGETAGGLRQAPVGVFFLHGQLAPAAWALAQAAPGMRVGYVQGAGGALPGAMSNVVRELRKRELLVSHVTAGLAYGGEREAITVAEAIDWGIREDGWDVALCGPGPGILGSASRLGHGGMAALDAAHAGLALGLPVVVIPRMSSGDKRERHRGLSHHTATVLEMLLNGVDVALPEGEAPEVGRHRTKTAAFALDDYRESGLPATTMGRSIEEDELFFAAALAAGTVIASLIRS